MTNDVNQSAQQNAFDVTADFNAHVSLNNLIGNRHAVGIAWAFIDQFYNDLPYANVQLSPILVTGQTGRYTFSRAMSNSFGNLLFKYGHGSFPHIAQDPDSFIHYSSYGTTFYIADIDKLNSTGQYKLWKILSERRLSIFDFENKVPITAPLKNGLYIFSAKKADALIEPLLSLLSVKINLAMLSEEQVLAAIKQRVKLLGLAYESESVLSGISQASGEDVDKAMELLALTYRLMRAKNKFSLTSKILNRALHLTNENIKALQVHLPR